MAAFPTAAVAVDVMKVHLREIFSDSRIGFNLKRISWKEMCITFPSNGRDVVFFTAICAAGVTNSLDSIADLKFAMGFLRRIEPAEWGLV